MACLSAPVILRPGRTPIGDWRAIAGGAAVALDPVARLDVEAGRAALLAIEARRGPAEPGTVDRSSSLAEMLGTGDAHVPEGEARLFVGLKLASLAQGTAGIRWELLETMTRLLSEDVLPIVPEGGGDRVALSQLFALLTGMGAALHHGAKTAARDALRQAGIELPGLTAHERTILLSGTAPSLAALLGDLFTAERVFHAALIAAALAAHVDGRPLGLFHPASHRLHRQRGQMEVAATLRALLAGDDADTRPSDAATNADLSAVPRIGAAFDLLRQAGAILERAANGVSEDALVIWQSEETVAGIEDSTALALAADLIAMAVGTLGLSVARLANIDDELGARALSLAAENAAEAGSATLDLSGLARVRPLVRRLSTLVATALLAATRHLATPPEGALGAAWQRLRMAASPQGAMSGDDAEAAIADAVRSGRLADPAAIPFPTIGPPKP
jgi:histidine ammonia-lyase